MLYTYIDSPPRVYICHLCKRGHSFYLRTPYLKHRSNTPWNWQNECYNSICSTTNIIRIDTASFIHLPILKKMNTNSVLYLYFVHVFLREFLYSKNRFNKHCLQLRQSRYIMHNDYRSWNWNINKRTNTDVLVLGTIWQL